MKKLFIIIAVLIIVAGVAWLLNSLNVLPEVDWMWTGWAGMCGVLVLVLGGWNKVSFVLGPFFIVVAATSLLKQTGVMNPVIEVPVLVIVLGVLLLLAVLLPLRIPRCLDERLVQKPENE